MTEHRAWLLDLDGTLYRPFPVKCLMAAELAISGWAQIRTLRRFRHEHEHLRQTQQDSVESPFEQQLQATALALGVDVERVRRVVQAWMIERPQKWIRRWARHELLAEARAFHARGGKLAVVSDYPARGKLQALPGLPPLDAIVASGEPGGPGRLKPYPDGYLEAARLLGVDPTQCLVIGDRHDADGLAAANAKMAFRLIA